MATQAGRNYLITGSGRGIGRGLSRLLLQNGHRVFLLDHNEEELTHTLCQLSKSHARGTAFAASVCDVRKPDHIASAVQEAQRFFAAHLDCLVNNAAHTAGVGGGALAELGLDVWNASLETNLTAPMLMARACLPLLRRSSSRRSGGCVVNVSSTRAFMSEMHNEPYAATKAGLLGLSQAMAVSLAEDGVRSNAILPGWIHVGDECKRADESGVKWEEGLSEEDHRWHLSGRVGRVEDVWRAVEYLVEAEFVTGAEMVVDGGVTRKMVYPE